MRQVVVFQKRARNASTPRYATKAASEEVVHQKS
jgi:hypothetical protein